MIRRVSISFVAALCVATTAPMRAHIAESHTQYLTFSQAVALPGVTLHAGTYVFELPDPGGAPDVVRVLSRDRKTVVLTAFTHLVDRPRSLPSTQLVSFREVPPNTPSPITVWWSEPSAGRQFLYVP